MIKIITDTASDITLTQAAKLDVELVSIGVSFSGEPYEQLADEGFSLFYSQLEASKDLPATSQPSPDAYLSLFLLAKKNGDDVVVICLSSALSGTFQSAKIARGLADYDRVHIVDSRQAVIGQRLLVELAVKLRGEGKSAEDIALALNDARCRIRLFGALDTLRYLRKGGRIPKSAEVLGTMMGIKPLIRLGCSGRITMAGKTRGHAGAVTGMLKLIGEDVDFDPAAPFYLGYTGDITYCRNFQKMVITKYRPGATAIYPVGPVVGTHIGPGAFAVCYLSKNRQGEDE